jgi:folate-binding protein YgfZ
MTSDEQVVRSARETVLACRARDRSGIVISGSDRVRWLNGLVTCDLSKLSGSSGAYGLIVEKKGRIATDFFLCTDEKDALALAVPRDLRGGLAATLDHFLIMEDAEIREQDLAFWWLSGPRSEDVRKALGAPWSANLAIFGAPGAIVGIPEAECDAFEAHVAARAHEAGGLFVDEPTWEAWRIERGVPRFGVEVDTTLYPQEASLEHLAVSFDKGCYLGQEVVYMLEHRGHPKRRLVALELDGTEIPSKGAIVTTLTETETGEIRSAARGPSTGKPVAIAMVKWTDSAEGTVLRVAGADARVR